MQVQNPYMDPMGLKKKQTLWKKWTDTLPQQFAAENGQSQIRNLHLRTIHFQVQAVSFRECTENDAGPLPAISRVTTPFMAVATPVIMQSLAT